MSPAHQTKEPGDAQSAAFKDRISAEGVRAVCGALEAAMTARFLPFDGQAAARAAMVGLEHLELKARVAQVADALDGALPTPRSPAVVAAILDALVEAAGPPLAGEDNVSAGFMYWPVLTWVERHALEHPALALPALAALTSRFSAEFAIRPFLLRWPVQAWAAVEAWAGAQDVHQRRLASEGTRPRLPWGQQLGPSVTDPSRGLALISRLVDDPSPYVRRSVANHLNDVSKDHPDLAAATAAQWMVDASPARAALVRHGLRSLRKAGHPAALAVLGLQDGGVQVQRWTLLSSRVSIGHRLEYSAVVRNDSGAPATLALDLLLRWPALRGGWAQRQLHWATLRLAPGEQRQVSGGHRVQRVTTRRVEPGPHRLALVVNGVERADAEFALCAPSGE